MGTVSVFGLVGAKSVPDAAPASPPEHESTDQPANRDKTTFADLGARIGEDNETLRNLLIDTSHQLNTIDSLKDTFGKLLDPLSNLLTTLEQERADNAGSQGALAAIRTSHEMLRAEFQALEKKSSELEGDNERLSRELVSARQNARALEDEKTKLNGEVAAARGAMAMLVKQLGEEVSNVRMQSNEKELLAERADTSDRRIAALEAEIAHARQCLSLLENDKDALQAVLDRTLAESARLSRHLAESESALSDARSRLRQMEGSLSTAESERTEAMRTAEARLLEAVVARGEAETKVEHLATASSRREQQTKELELEVAVLTERCRVLSQTLAANESSLTNANEKIRLLAGHIERLQVDAVAYRAETEEYIVQLDATIEHERCERALAEGALATTRADYARIQRQMLQERSTRRVDHQRRIIRNNLMP